jgi:hypothetical protein
VSARYPLPRDDTLNKILLPRTTEHSSATAAV